MFHRNIKRIWLLVAAMLLGSLPSLFVLGDEPADRLRNKNKKAQEWPQFHGPKRNNISTDTGLLKRWPEDGPKLVWQAGGLGKGWATVAISGGFVYTAGDIGPDTMITAMDFSGTKIWQTKNGLAYKKNPPGARATPTLSDGKLYHL
ncbi:MAG: hypothetical protein IIA49_09130, partial [Bacteroidetes bacterium]|nr:hypothetical protein [Bacteroidota bacterium]